MKIKLISTSDVHGYLAPTDYSSRDNVAPFSLSRVATVIQDLTREDSNEVWPIVIDNGDYVQGSPLTYFIARPPPGSGAALFPASQLQPRAGRYFWQS